MMCILLAAGAATVIVLFMIAAIQTAGRCSRAEEEAERKRWKEMQRREEANRKP